MARDPESARSSTDARKLADERKRGDDAVEELASTYAHLRSVISNCLYSPVETIRIQLVGLLPEVQDFEPEVKDRMREKGMSDLVERREQDVRAGWAEYGYGEQDG